MADHAEFILAPREAQSRGLIRPVSAVPAKSFQVQVFLGPSLFRVFLGQGWFYVIHL
jgi:hypothetical protein